jgi:hypothetical protein
MLCALVAAAGCATASNAPMPPPSAEAASLKLNRLEAAEPETFKMLHQVVARFQGRSFPMTGYLLGRRDGSFRVSANLPMGPKLFDIAKLSGHWESKIYLPDAASRVDPLEIGRSVERIYFIEGRGLLKFSEGAWVSRQSLAEEDIDAVEVWHDTDDFAVIRKRFFRKDRMVLEIVYDQRQVMQGQLIARRVVLTDVRGFNLELAVTDYQPGFPVPDELLKLGQ